MVSFASIYAGAGGLDLGFAQAGYSPVYVNEFDPDAFQTHAALLEAFEEPGAVDSVCGDIDSIRWPRPRSVDVVVGGPPCQGFSVAGRMDPADPRSRHIFRFLDFVAAVQPKAFVMENVAALAVNTRWNELVDTFRMKAHAIGFTVAVLVLSASDFGVPQSRRRAFFVGLRDPFDIETPLQRLRLPSASAGDVLRGLPPLGSPGNSGLVDARITFARNPVLRRSPYAGMMFNGSGRPIDLEGRAGTLTASMGGNRTPIIDEDSLRFGSRPWVLDYHGRLVCGLRPYVGEAPARLRRISVEEAAALQGFPREATWFGSRVSQLRQIGNAVPPPLSQAVARALGTALGHVGSDSAPLEAATAGVAR